MSGAASGVAVDDACVQTYMDVKRKRAHKFVLYHIGAFAPRLARTRTLHSMTTESCLAAPPCELEGVEQ